MIECTGESDINRNEEPQRRQSPHPMRGHLEVQYREYDTCLQGGGSGEQSPGHDPASVGQSPPDDTENEEDDTSSETNNTSRKKPRKRTRVTNDIWEDEDAIKWIKLVENIL